MGRCTVADKYLDIDRTLSESATQLIKDQRAIRADDPELANRIDRLVSEIRAAKAETARRLELASVA